MPTKKKTTPRRTARKRDQSLEETLIEAGFERVVPLSSPAELALALGRLAARMELSTHVPKAREVSRILRVIEADIRGGKGRRAFEWVSELAPKAEDRLAKWNSGPRTRQGEASYLKSVMDAGLASAHDAVQIAERLLGVLRCCPLICSETRVPPNGAWTNKEDDIRAVQHAVNKVFAVSERDAVEAEQLVRAALRSVGYPPAKAKALYEAQRKSSDRQAAQRRK